MIVAVSISVTAAYSLFLEDIYQASAIISPVSSRESGQGNFSLLTQQLGGLPGITLPSSASDAEIVNLLKSNRLREEVIKEHNLLPILFHEKWDNEKKDWKRDKRSVLSPSVLTQKFIKIIKPDNINTSTDNQSGAPSLWDGLRLLSNIVKVSKNVKDNTITGSVELYDPELAANIAGYFLDTLTDHMSNESKKVATINKKYLEEQLGKTTDPFIRQKLYNLIAQQLETIMMSEVKENMAFKIIDPPKTPDRKIKPKRSAIVMTSFLISFFVGLLVVFLMENTKKAMR